METLMTTSATATGGRGGTVATDDGRHSFTMSLPGALGGDGKGANPEELFAMGYAACFGQAVMVVAKDHGVDPSQARVTCTVHLNKGDDGFSIAADLTLAIAGQDPATVEKVLHAAHQVCPYSKATRNNIPVTLSVG